ncbi:ATP-binding protein [Patescibacteria group bacterium]|nr:ATP-binding protein [Patescibacteria group bacterium]MBU1499281.1 ATP-binding protein [Patescibacteria group bacterium]
MIKRELETKLKSLFKKLPLVALIGPRQSGKTFLLKNTFPKIKYVSLEDLDQRTFAREDPRRFLSTYQPPVILDEVQRVPELFSYLQTQTDNLDKPGQYFLSGSQNFLLMENISQSLAGRIGLLTLLPLSLGELGAGKEIKTNLDQILLKGFYPRPWVKKISPNDWFPGYIQTYLEGDVRQIKNITDLTLFQRFLKLCAGRTGQVLNLSTLAADCGITHNTVQAWLSVLEASYIIFKLQPYFKNLNKRLVKSPKLYFYDTGLACSLLGIETAGQLVNYPLRGALFETMAVSELIKNKFNQGRLPQAFWLSDKSGHEVDYVTEEGGRITGIEIKAGETFSQDYFINLKYWQERKIIKPKDSLVIYGGEEDQIRKSGQLKSWRRLPQIIV